MLQNMARVGLAGRGHARTIGNYRSTASEPMSYSLVGRYELSFGTIRTRQDDFLRFDALETRRNALEGRGLRGFVELGADEPVRGRLAEVEGIEDRAF